MDFQADKERNSNAMATALASHPKIIVNVSPGEYHMATPTPVKGGWFYVTTCPNCNNRTPIIGDYHNGTGASERFSGGGIFIVDCLICHKPVVAEPANLTIEQW